MYKQIGLEDQSSDSETEFEDINKLLKSDGSKASSKKTKSPTAKMIAEITGKLEETCKNRLDEEEFENAEFDIVNLFRQAAEKDEGQIKALRKAKLVLAAALEKAKPKVIVPAATGASSSSKAAPQTAPTTIVAENTEQIGPTQMDIGEDATPKSPTVAEALRKLSSDKKEQ